MTAITGRTSTSTSTSSPSPSRAGAGGHQQVEQDLPSVSKAAAWSFAGSVGACLLLLVAAMGAGADLEVVRSDGRTVTITPSSVVVTVMLAVLAGVALLSLVGRTRRAWAAVAVTGLVLGLASVAAPVTSEASTVTGAVLVAMHVACAVTWFTVLTTLLRRR